MTDKPEQPTARRLRDWCKTIRTKPTPLSDAIQMVQQAADVIDEHAARIAELEARAKADDEVWLKTYHRLIQQIEKMRRGTWVEP